MFQSSVRYRAAAAAGRLSHAGRNGIGRVCRLTSFTRALESLPGPACLLVLNYHRIGTPGEDPYDPGIFSATADEFDWQIAFLAAHYPVVTLDRALSCVENPGALRTIEVLITFDDGYLDNYLTAWPILRKHGVPATFFLATSFIGTDRLPWWDAIAATINASTRSRAVLRYPAEHVLILNGSRKTAIQRSLRLYKSAVGDTDQFLQALADACGVPPPLHAPSRLFLNWGEAAEMQRSGMSIGSHTHTHLTLAKLPLDQQWTELHRSYHAIRENLGSPPAAIAYPVGHCGSFSAETTSLLPQVGYRAGFSFYGGVNRSPAIERYNLKREPVDVFTSNSLFRLRCALTSRVGHRVV